MKAFRTQQEVNRALWAQKRMSVTEGRLYTESADTPFPIHEYFKLGLLGKEVKMVEVNAGHAMVENITADTLTDLSVQFFKDEKKENLDAATEAEFVQFMKDIEYEETHEQFIRSLYGSGYGVEQPVKQPDEGTDGGDLISVCNVDPSTWYPDIPAFAWQKVKSGRIITTYCEKDDKGANKWFAFVERHTIGKVEYELYIVDNADSLEGTKVELGVSDRFKGITVTEAQTGLTELAVFQQNRRKSAGYIFGNSILSPVWSILQEVSEFQTQIRQERIKHFRSRLYAERDSLARARNVPNADAKDASFRFDSKEMREADSGGANLSDATQDVFVISPGGTPPGYIQWDMAILEAGSKEIDKILSRAAAVSGFPRSVFNLDDRGEMHVETDRRKNRRYVQQVIQGQRRSEAEIMRIALAWWSWKKGGDKSTKPVVEVKRAPPFDLSQQEIIDMMRSQNPSADFISQKEAMRKINPTMSEEQIDKMIAEIRDEQQMLTPANSLLDNAPTVNLP